MQTLVSAGAFTKVHNGWSVSNTSIAKDIVYACGITLSPTTSTPSKKKTAASKNKRKIKPRKPTSIRSIPIARTRSVGISSSKPPADPKARELKLEKANRTHDSLVLDIANVIRSAGIAALEDPNSFDVGVNQLSQEALIEVKTITHTNCRSQLRKAVAQLPEYRWINRKNGYPSTTKLIIVTDVDPRRFEDPDYLTFVENELGIRICWRDGGSIVALDGKTILDVLTL
jgi:hypothetical protein